MKDACAVCSNWQAIAQTGLGKRVNQHTEPQVEVTQASMQQLGWGKHCAVRLIVLEWAGRQQQQSKLIACMGRQAATAIRTD
jgi:hypothetical protein